MAIKTALAKSPSTSNKPSSRGKSRTDFQNALKTIRRADVDTEEYNAALAKVNKLGPRTGYSNWQQSVTNATNVSPERKFAMKTPEQRAQALEMQAGQFYNRMMKGTEGFDPNRPFAGYEMGFGEARDKAYGDVMAQFNRSMEPEFQRQNAEFQQRMADQGLDPNSGAYQAQFKALADAQNNARLNAQSQAAQQAYQVQEQAFGQGQAAAMTPFQQWQASNQPFLLPMQQRGDMSLAQMQERARMQQIQAQNAAGIQQANIAAGTSRANTLAQIEAENERYRRENVGSYPASPKRPSNSFASGVMSTLPGGITGGAIRR